MERPNIRTVFWVCTYNFSSDISDPSVDEVGERTNELTNTVLSLLLQQFTVLYTVCNRSIQHGNNSECRKGDSHDGKQVIINVQIR
jgi:hypothetical protein